MSYFNIDKIYTVIDIGTTKICVIIAKYDSNNIENNKIQILGIGISKSDGLHKGVIEDIPKTIKSISEALNEAKIMAGYEPESVYIGISGHHIRSYYSQGMASVKNSIIREDTVNEALNASMAISLPDDEKILHTIPISYVIDGINNVKNPHGMHGMRLEVSSHIITANVNSIEDMISCCNACGIKVIDVVLEPIASAYAILNEEERQLGALLVDIGGGTTDVAFYKNGALNYTEIISIAGKVFTQDLSICLRILNSEAEEIKKQYGIMTESSNINNEITVKSIDASHELIYPIRLINEILYERSKELIEILNFGMHRYSPIYNIPSGIILTGGGSLLNGLTELTSSITGLPTRIGVPKIDELYKDILSHPSYSTSCGLLYYAIQEDQKQDINFSKESFISRLFWKMRAWIN